MTTTTQHMKRAWIRDPQVPPGQPAPGRISCPCGNAPLSRFGDGNDVHCACGTVYDCKGWIIYDPADGVSMEDAVSRYLAG